MVNNLHARETEYKQILSKLIEAKKCRLDVRRLSAVPISHGLYAISEIGASEGEYLHAGRTEDGCQGLRGRMYQHRSGNTCGDLREKAVANGRCQTKDDAGKFIRRNCQAQWVEVQNNALRKSAEHYILALLKPIWGS